MQRTLIPTLLGVSLAPMAAFAQDGGEASQTIVVTATRSLKPIDKVPGAVSLITSTDLSTQRTITDDPSAVLATLVPGYAPSRQKATTFGETFRGRGALILFDGVPQTNPLRGGARESYFADQAVIERVEVIAGANALQGLGATGGLINYVSRTPNRDGVEHQLDLRANSQFKSESMGWGLSYTGAYKAEAFDALLQVGTQQRGMNYDGNGRLMGIDNTQGDTMDSSADNVFVKFGYNGNGFRLQASFNHYELEGDGNFRLQSGNRALGLTTTSVRGAPVGEPIRNEVETGNVQLTIADRFGGQLSAQVFSQRFASSFGAGIFPVFQDANIAPVGTLVDQSQITADKLGTKIAYATPEFLWPGLSATLGLDVLRDTTNQRLAATGRLFVPNLELTNVAPFVQVELEAGPVTATAGLRSERVRLRVPAYQTLAFYNSASVGTGAQSFTENIPNLGLIYRFTKDLSAFASVSRGFGLSDVGLVLRAVNRPVEDAGSLVDLKPVVVKNQEVGISFKGGAFAAAASVYQSTSELGTAILTDSFGNPFVVRRPTEIRGLEATVAYTAGAVRADATYSRMRGRTASVNGGDIDSDLGIASQSPDKLTAGVTARLFEKATLRVQGTHLMDRELNSGRPNAESFKGYTLVDASMAYRTPIGTWSVGIENLTDRFWVGPFPQSSAGSRTNNDDFFAGRGRTYTLTWSVGF